MMFGVNCKYLYMSLCVCVCVCVCVCDVVYSMLFILFTERIYGFSMILKKEPG
jgi:hypothetical protein